MKDELGRECKWERENSQGSKLELVKISKTDGTGGRGCRKDWSSSQWGRCKTSGEWILVGFFNETEKAIKICHWVKLVGYLYTQEEIHIYQ